MKNLSEIEKIIDTEQQHLIFLEYKKIDEEFRMNFIRFYNLACFEENLFNDLRSDQIDKLNK